MALRQRLGVLEEWCHQIEVAHETSDNELITEKYSGNWNRKIRTSRRDIL